MAAVSITVGTRLGGEVTTLVEGHARLYANSKLLSLILGLGRGQELRNLGLVVFGHELGVVASLGEQWPLEARANQAGAP